MAPLSQNYWWVNKGKELFRISDSEELKRVDVNRVVRASLREKGLGKDERSFLMGAPGFNLDAFTNW